MVYGINFLIQPRSMMSKNNVTFISRMQKSMQLKLSFANVRLQGGAGCDVNDFVCRICNTSLPLKDFGRV